MANRSDPEALALAGRSLESRRRFLAGAAFAATSASAATVFSAPAPASAALPASPDVAGIDVTDQGAKGDGVTDDTDAFASAVKKAAGLRGRVVVPAGTYLVDSVTVPLLVKIEGMAADVSRYGAGTSGGVNLRHRRDSTRPLLVIDGPGVTLENLGLQGNGSTAPLIRVDNGFESRFSRLQLSGVSGTALQVERVNNNLWTDVFVNNSGSASAAAVVVKSPPTGTNSNTFTCVNFTIEGSPNGALDLGFGSAPGAYVEFVRIFGLHVEGIQTAPSPGPLVRIGNVRQVEFVSPFLYGGPGAVLEHRMQRGSTVELTNGVRIIGGCLLGADGKTGVATSEIVSLVSGDDFALIGTRVGRFSRAGIHLGSGYGSRFFLDPTTRIQNWGTSAALLDERTTTAEVSWRCPAAIDVDRSLSIGGHVVASKPVGPKPTVSSLPALGASGPTPTLTGSDTTGTVGFGVGAKPSAGAQLRITFGTPFAMPPTVQLTPRSAKAAALDHYVTVTKDYFDLCLTSPLPAGAWLTHGYLVIG